MLGGCQAVGVPSSGCAGALALKSVPDALDASDGAGVEFPSELVAEFVEEAVGSSTSASEVKLVLPVPGADDGSASSGGSPLVLDPIPASGEDVVGCPY
jgi:hypothetical protein